MKKKRAMYDIYVGKKGEYQMKIGFTQDPRAFKERTNFRKGELLFKCEGEKDKRM